MSKIIFAILLSICFSLNAKEPSAEFSEYLTVIKGRVTDQSTGEGLAGVRVSLAGSELKTFTDFEGNFSFENINSGEYSVVTEYISYSKRTIRGVKPGNDLLIIKLKTDSVNVVKSFNEISVSS